MKALTLTQPWAQLVVDGRKRFETRGWRTTFRGFLAIHAAKGWDPYEDVYQALQWGYDPNNLPRGAIVGMVRVVDCTPTLGDGESFRHEPEYHYGNFEPGRWKWHLELVGKLLVPVPCRGALGLWTVPEDVASAVFNGEVADQEATP